MATHEQLFPLLVGAIRGDKVKPLGIDGGSVNYRLMDDTTTWIVDPSLKNEDVLLGHLKEMKEVGHMTLAGPKGVACEQGSPGMHWTFNMGSIVGALKYAVQRNRRELIARCQDAILDEVG